jgi:hypothetical protein
MNARTSKKLLLLSQISSQLVGVLLLLVAAGVSSTPTAGVSTESAGSAAGFSAGSASGAGSAGDELVGSLPGSCTDATLAAAAAEAPTCGFRDHAFNGASSVCVTSESSFPLAKAAQDFLGDPVVGRTLLCNFRASVLQVVSIPCDLGLSPCQFTLTLV